MVKRTSLFFSILLLPAMAHAALSVQLSISPAHTLPSLPVSFHIAIDNPDASAHSIPRGGILIVTPAGGSPWVAVPRNKIVEDLALWMDGVTTVAPHGHYAFDIPVDSTLDNPEWFTDRRLRVVGSYRLQLILADVNADQLRGLEPAAIATVLPSTAVSSNEVALFIDAPKGDDAAVWQLLVGEAARQDRSIVWLSAPRALVKRIWTDYPNSTYSRYLVTHVGLETVDETITAIQAALAAAPNDPFADWEQLQIAELEYHLYGDAHGHGRDASTLKEHAERAARMYRVVIKTGHSALVRSVAQRKLDDLLSDLEDDGISVPTPPAPPLAVPASAPVSR